MAFRHSALLICLLLAASASAQTAREYLDRVADTYKHLTSLQVETDVDQGRSEQFEGVKLSMVLYAAQPHRARIETKDASHVLWSALISKGDSTVEYDARKKRYTTFPGTVSVSFDPDRGTGPGEMLYDTITDKLRSASIRGNQTLDVGKDEIPCVVVSADYETSSKLGRYSFWIAKNGLVFRRLVTYWDGRGVHALLSTVTALTANENVPEETFEFQPPPGVKESPLPTGPAVLAAR